MNQQHQPAVSTTATTLGAYVRDARERAGLSLRNLEALTGISRPMLHRLEHDQIDQPSPTLLQRIANALEVDSGDLFAFIGYQPSQTLPSLMPYLRAKYHLPPEAAAEVHAALDSIFAKYDADHQRDEQPAGGQEQLPQDNDAL